MGSPAVSFYLKQLGAPDVIRCARCTLPQSFTLHMEGIVEFCHALHWTAVRTKNEVLFLRAEGVVSHYNYIVASKLKGPSLGHCRNKFEHHPPNS